MKKTLSILLVAVLLLGSVFMLSSCGLSGTYKSALGTSLTFSGNTVTIEQNIVIGTTTPIVANYSIGEDENGNRIITISYDDGAEQHDTLKGALPYGEGSDDKGSYIEILYIKYYKQ